MQRDIVERAQRGDQAAFEELAGGAIDRLFGAARLILRDSDLAEDAVQETLIRTWRDLPRLRQPDRFTVWQRRILIHACMDVARKSRHPGERAALPLSLASKDHVEAEVVARDAVARAFARLSPNDRSVLVLRHFLACTVGEIAEVLAIPLGTAKSRLHRAEVAMRSEIDGHGRPATEGGVT